MIRTPGSSGSGRAGCYCCCYCCCSGYASACCYSDRFSCLAFIPALKLPALRSTPRVKPLELQLSNVQIARLIRTALRTPSAQALCSSISHGFCRTSQSTKTRSPAIRRSRAGCTKSFSLRKQARMSHVKIQAQSQLSFALRSQWRSSQKPSRSIGPAFLEPFNRAGSRFENSGLIRRTYGASDPEPNL